MKLETLAQAIAKLDRAMSNCETVTTISSVITNATEFTIVSEAVDTVARDNNVYLGEKRWIKTQYGYELRVGFAPSMRAWDEVYDAKQPSLWRKAR